MTDHYEYGVDARPGSLVDPERYGWVDCPGFAYRVPESGNRVEPFEHDDHPGYMLNYEIAASSDELLNVTLEDPDGSVSRIEPLTLTDALRWPDSMNKEAAVSETTERMDRSPAHISALAAPVPITQALAGETTPSSPQSSRATDPTHRTQDSGRDLMER